MTSRQPRSDRRRLSWDDLSGILRSEIAQADGAASDELDRVRAEAIKRYYGKPRGDERAGRSKVQSHDIPDMLEAVKADIAPSLTRPNVCRFSPLSEDDEQQADLETAACSKVIYQDNDGFNVIVTAIVDALLCRTCWARFERVTWTESHDETLRGLSGDSVGLALQPKAQNEEVELLEQEETATDLMGEPVYTIRVRRVWTHERFEFDSVAPEDMIYSPDWRSVSVDGIRFHAEFKRMERGELLEMDVPMSVVEDLPVSPIEARGAAVERWTTATGQQSGGHDFSTELVEVYRCFLRVDMNGDGIPELHEIYYAGERVIKEREVKHSCYINGMAILRAYRLDGISLYDRLKGVQEIKTGGLRSWMDNLTIQNMGRVGVVEGEVNIGDWARARQNGYVRIKKADSVVPLLVHDAGPSTRALLDYSDKMRSEAGGAALDLQSAEAQIAGHTAGGTERQYSAREKLSKMMCITLAETFLRATYRLVHRTLRTEAQSEIDLKRNGEWQRTDPRRWSQRQSLEVNAGKTRSEQLARNAALTQVIAQQEKYLQAGFDGIYTDASKLHNALIDWTETAHLEAPDQYWIDPSSQGARQAAEQRDEQMRAERAQNEQQQAALVRLSLNFERWKEEQQNQRSRDELRFKYIEAALESEAKEAEIVADGTTELAKAQLRAVESTP